MIRNLNTKVKIGKREISQMETYLEKYERKNINSVKVRQMVVDQEIEELQ